MTLNYLLWTKLLFKHFLKCQTCFFQNVCWSVSHWSAERPHHPSPPTSIRWYTYNAIIIMIWAHSPTSGLCFGLYYLKFSSSATFMCEEYAWGGVSVVAFHEDDDLSVKNFPLFEFFYASSSFSRSGTSTNPRAPTGAQVGSSLTIQ